MKQILFLLLVFSNFVQAQDYRFGKVSVQELEKTNSTVTPNASAEILYSSEKVTIDWNFQKGDIEKKVVDFYRIKVYNKNQAPRNAFVHQVKLRKNNANIEKISNLKVVTYNLENGKIVETKIDKKDIVSDKTSKYHNLETFTFPNVKDGSVIEFSYEIISPFYQFTEPWYFQTNIPVVKSDFSIETNESLRYQPFVTGQLEPKTNTKEKQEKTASVSNTIRYRMQGGNLIDTKTNYENYRYTMDINNYSYENLAPIYLEAYILNPKNLFSAIRFELAAYIPKNGNPQFFTTDWNTIGKDLMKSETFGEQLNGNGFLDKKVKELTANKSTPTEKMKAIFDFVKNNYRWNNVYGIATDNGVRKTFNDQTGSVTDINLLLISMLQKADLTANPIVLSSTDNGILDFSFPSKHKLNYVIAHVYDNGKNYLMDATSPHSDINLLPIRALNYRGMLITPNGTTEFPLQNYVMSNRKITVDADLSDAGEFSGRYTDTADNYFYLIDSEAYHDNQKGFEEDKTNSFDMKVENFRVQDNNEGLMRQTFNFSNLKVEKIGYKLIFNPLLFLSETKSNLFFNTRNHPLEFGTPSTITKTIKIKIPSGYKVESLPTQDTSLVKDNAASYIYAIAQKDDYILVQTQELLPYATLPNKYYRDFKDYKNKLILINSQHVVLVKE